MRGTFCRALFFRQVEVSQELSQLGPVGSPRKSGAVFGVVDYIFAVGDGVVVAAKD